MFSVQPDPHCRAGGDSRHLDSREAEVHARALRRLLHHAPVENVLHAHEASNVDARGALEDFLGRRELRDASRAHDRDPRRALDRFLEVVGYEDERGAEGTLELDQLRPHRGAKLRVEGGERFIEEQDVGLEHEGAGEGHALALASGDLGGGAPAETLEPHRGERLLDPRPDLRLGPGAQSQAEGHVLEDREVREERVALENRVHRTKVGLHQSDVGAGDRDPPGVGLVEPGDEPQQCGLAAARGPEEGHELARPHRQADLVQDHVAPAFLRDRFDREETAHFFCGSTFAHVPR